MTLGQHPASIDMPLLADSLMGEDMARALLANHAAPHPWLAVTVDATADAALLTHALARDVGDRLHVTDDDLALDAEACFIERITHRVERGGARHTVTWATSPVDLAAYWVLGSSDAAKLSEGTRLGY